MLIHIFINVMFWNKRCEKISQLLWKPSLLINHKPLQKNNFNCNNKNISFNYFSNGIKINPKLEFRDISIIDNTPKKIRLEKQLYEKELKRFYKELAKPINKEYNEINNEKLLTKHCDFLDKNEIKVKNLDGFVRSRRIQIFPSDRQKMIIKKWLQDTTIIYNRLVNHFNQIYNDFYTVVSEMDITDKDKGVQLGKLLKKNVSFPINFKKLRELKINDFTTEYDKTPYCIIADTIKEFTSNAKSNITKLLKRQQDSFKFNRRAFNRDYFSIEIEKHYTNSDGFYPSILGPMKVNDVDFEWSEIACDYKLIYDGYTKKYYIHAPRHVFKKEINYERKKIAVMDPGERTFQMLYGLDHVIAIGEKMKKPIMKILHKVDRLKEKMKDKRKYKYNKKLKKKTKRKKNRYKKAANRHEKKIRNMVDEMHHKTALYLCKNYERVMVTDFSAKKVSSKKGDLNKESKRVLGKLSHYRFKQCLMNKCQEYGCQYMEVNESYTSKTCSNCGNVKKDLGDLEIYECKKCKKRMHRDINGAINILIKNEKLVIK